MSPKKAEALSNFALTALDIAGANFAGPYAGLVTGLITAFNGGQVDPGQAALSAQASYNDIYKDAPAADASGDQYPAEEHMAAAGAATSQSPTISASLIHAGPGGELDLLDNGATLRGPGNGHAGDRVGLFFAPENTSYVYVVSVDGTGWTQTLFPDPALNHRNPVAADEEIVLPGEELYGLDNVRGVETIYILASNQPRPDLEAQLQPFLGKERPPATGGSSFRSVERPIIISRGLTGVRPGTAAPAAKAQSGNRPASLPLNTFVAADGENEIALTLWFNHE